MTKKLLLLRFLFVGGSTAAIFLGLTFILVEGQFMHAALASTIACVAAVCYNYFLHYHWTFASDAPHGTVLMKYCLMCAGGVILNGLVMYFGVALGLMHYMLVQVIAGVVLVFWSFTISSIWVFRAQ
jgi:putative flippase GtrA